MEREWGVYGVRISLFGSDGEVWKDFSFEETLGEKPLYAEESSADGFRIVRGATASGIVEVAASPGRVDLVHMTRPKRPNVLLPLHRSPGVAAKDWAKLVQKVIELKPRSRVALGIFFGTIVESQEQGDQLVQSKFGCAPIPQLSNRATSELLFRYNFPTKISLSGGPVDTNVVLQWFTEKQNFSASTIFTISTDGEEESDLQLASMEQYLTRVMFDINTSAVIDRVMEPSEVLEFITWAADEAESIAGQL